MVELSVKYNRDKKPVTIELSFAEKWNELSVSNILYIGNYWQSWLMMMKENMSMRKARAMLFIELTNIKSKLRQKELLEALSLVDPDDGFNMLDFTDFIFNGIDLTKNLLPEIQVEGKTLVGPSDRITNISIDEFTFAFSCYQLWHSTGEEIHLENLAGVLYRPLNKDFERTGERREPFNKDLIERNGALFKALPDGYKNAVFLFFKGCLELLSKRYEEVFNSKGEGKASGSFKDIVVGISGGKFGTFDQTKRENLYVVVDELKQMIIESQKNKKK